MIRRGITYLVSVMILAVAAVVVIGYLLPQEHRAMGSATIASPPGRVFEVISDVARYPEWRDDVSAVEILAREPLRWRERSGGDALTFEVVESRPPERIRVRIADPDLPFAGTWTYALVPDAGGTRITIVEDGEVYNPVFRFISRFVIGHTATIDRFLANLQATFG
jgi:uncharacterized membrane protein